MPTELTVADWDQAKKLMLLNTGQLHKLRLVDLRSGAQLLLALSDELKDRGRALHKFADGREAVGEQG
jgi:hypothetical protein